MSRYELFKMIFQFLIMFLILGIAMYLSIKGGIGKRFVFRNTSNRNTETGLITVTVSCLDTKLDVFIYVGEQEMASDWQTAAKVALEEREKAEQALREYKAYQKALRTRRYVDNPVLMATEDEEVLLSGLLPGSLFIWDNTIALKTKFDDECYTFGDGGVFNGDGISEPEIIKELKVKPLIVHFKNREV